MSKIALSPTDAIPAPAPDILQRVLDGAKDKRKFSELTEREQEVCVNAYRLALNSGAVGYQLMVAVAEAVDPGKSAGKVFSDNDGGRQLQKLLNAAQMVGLADGGNKIIDARKAAARQAQTHATT